MLASFFETVSKGSGQAIFSVIRKALENGERITCRQNL